MEGLALYQGHEQGTLSAHTRMVLGIHPARPWRPVGVAGLVALCVWFPYHIAKQMDHTHGR